MKLLVVGELNNDLWYTDYTEIGVVENTLSIGSTLFEGVKAAIDGGFSGVYISEEETLKSVFSLKKVCQEANLTVYVRCTKREESQEGYWDTVYFPMALDDYIEGSIYRH